MLEFNKENLKFALEFGIKRLRVDADGVKFEEADYAEIAEINHLLSEARDRQRKEDFYAELSAKDIYASSND